MFVLKTAQRLFGSSLNVILLISSASMVNRSSHNQNIVHIHRKVLDT